MDTTLRRAAALGILAALLVGPVGDDLRSHGPESHATEARPPTNVAPRADRVSPRQSPTRRPRAPKPEEPGPRGVVTLAFAGDVHFEGHLSALLDRPREGLGPIARTLKAADLTMVNLESAVAGGGRPDPKELEVPSNRYWFHTSPRALDVLAAAGVDVVSVANNHGADYGPAGLAETLRARRDGPVAVVGVGKNRRDAFTPYRATIRGTNIAVLAADASPREGMSPTWAASAGPHAAGIAAAHSRRPRALLQAVRNADRTSDIVVVYLHWGLELHSCPIPGQQSLARQLAAAGADVIVGSHTHVLVGSGWLGETYVDYGLGNFVWYHDYQPETGVLRLTIRDGKVVRDGWVPARIQTSGLPLAATGAAREDSMAAWRGLRWCTGLVPQGREQQRRQQPRHEQPRHEQQRPPYSWAVRPIGPALAHRMRSSHRPGCPVPLTDLRYLRMTYLGFDREAHLGEMVVHERYVRPVTRVFQQLYDADWPIRRMRLVDDYGGDDERSMAADNTSGFNCRQVAGSTSWSAHAYGAAVDINPVENPYVTSGSVSPSAGGRFAEVDRSTGAQAARGVITSDGPVTLAFTRIGWVWGGSWSEGDFQHFSALE